MGIGKMFSDPAIFSKLASNPRTAKHLADASFMQKVCVLCARLQRPSLVSYSLSLQLQLVQQNPQLAQSLIGSDPRMIDVLGALMGIDMQGFSRPEGSDEVPPGVPKSAASPPSSPPPSARPPSSSAAASSSKVHEPEDVKMADQAEAEGDEDAAAKKEAEAEKKLGADAYRKRDFATAITHFSKAWDTWPKDMSFLTNLAGEAVFGLVRGRVTNVPVGSIFVCAAAYFEQGEYDKSIEACQKAVDEGREVILLFCSIVMTDIHSEIFSFIIFILRCARITSLSQKHTAALALPTPKRKTWAPQSGSSKNHWPNTARRIF
jgi:stress-induced-phosphoprotein 1